MPGRDEPRTKPWDARLVEWMSRGSDTARGGRMTPEAACFIAVGYVVLAVLNHNPGWYVLAALAVANALRVLIRARNTD
jgi:hypothetical protein